MNARLDALEARVGAWFAELDRRLAGRGDRIAGVLFGGGASLVIGIAMMLTPDAHGYGTHQQLGLGACTMMQLTNWPCPMCGMTTTFTLFAHARPIDAVVNQPFGLVLFPATVAVAALGLVDIVAARGALRAGLSWVQRRERTWAGVLLFGMLGGWIYKCVAMHPGAFHAPW